MKQEHHEAQVLRWIADGEQVQFLSCTGVWVNEAPYQTLNRISTAERGKYKYRLAPRMVKVGKRLIEAPITAALEHQEVWWVNPATSSALCAPYQSGSRALSYLLHRGLLFASEAAAIAADDAITVVMSGKESGE